MATVSPDSSGSAGAALGYAGGKACVETGIDCDSDYRLAIEQFEIVRKDAGKNDGLQCQILYHSFAPGEVTSDGKPLTSALAHKIGVELANELRKGHAKGFQIWVGTHTDKKHIHNHIIINSVSTDTGRKYQRSNADYRDMLKINDRLCIEYGLSVPIKGIGKGYSRAEKELIAKGQTPWKDYIRNAIDTAVAKSKTYTEFKDILKRESGVTIDESRKSNTYHHPDYRKGDTKAEKLKVRGDTLGDKYTREAVKTAIAKNREVIVEKQVVKLPSIQEVKNESADKPITTVDTNTSGGAIQQLPAGRERQNYRRKRRDFEREERSARLGAVSVPDVRQIVSDLGNAGDALKSAGQAPSRPITSDNESQRSDPISEYLKKWFEPDKQQSDKQPERASQSAENELEKRVEPDTGNVPEKPKPVYRGPSL